MFVRAKDKEHNRFYKSMVYGIINPGYYEQAILFNPFTQCFELIDYLDKDNKELRPLYEHINPNRADWISYDNECLLKIANYLKSKKFETKIRLLQGYSEVVNDFEFIYKILKDKKIELSKTTQPVRNNEDEQEWNYIRSQEDANKFMELFIGFHDSTLDKLSYEENYEKRQLNVIFDNSAWYGIVEFCFEGLIRMNLKGLGENYTRELYGASLCVRDETIYWVDTETEQNNIEYDGTWIKALNLKWKKIG